MIIPILRDAVLGDAPAVKPTRASPVNLRIAAAFQVPRAQFFPDVGR